LEKEYIHLIDCRDFLLLNEAGFNLSRDITKADIFIYLRAKLGDDKIKSLRELLVSKEGLYAQRDELFDSFQSLLLDTLQAKQIKLAYQTARVLRVVRSEIGGSAGLSSTSVPTLTLNECPSKEKKRVIEGRFKKDVGSRLPFSLISISFLRLFLSF
jgi:hypothetical protein